MYTYICVYRLIKINIFLFSAFFAKLVKKKKERRGKLDSRIGWEKGKSKRKRRNRGSVNLYSSFKREWFVRQSSFSGLTRGGVFRGSCRGLPPSARESILFPPTSFPRVPFSCRRHMDVAQKDARNGGPSKRENERPLLSQRNFAYRLPRYSSTFLATSLSRANLILGSFCPSCHLEFLHDGNRFESFRRGFSTTI